MHRHALTIAAMLICMALTVGIQAKDVSEDQAGNVTIVQKRVTSDDKTFELVFEIANRSGHDVWICESMDGRCEFEAYPEPNRHTLLIMRRLNASTSAGREDDPVGRYVRLRSDGTRTETVSLSLPMRGHFMPSARRESEPQRATRLVLEIGCYDGDLPAAVGRSAFDDPSTRSVWTKEDQVLIRWNRKGLKGEKVLRLTVESVIISYSTEYDKPTPIHLTPCKQIDVHFARSPLEFFFPYAQEQSLLSSEEKEHVEALKDSVLTNWQDVLGIAYHASEALPGAFFTERGMADLICHRKDGSTVSLTVRGDEYIVTQDGQVFRCLDGLPPLRTLTPQIHAFDLRMQCAANLKRLWDDLHRYRITRDTPRSSEKLLKPYMERGYVFPPHASASRVEVYPLPGEWCDALARGPRPADGREVRALVEQSCPSAGKGKCHYAMNPACRPDSPGDMVLLVETKNAWNQHGGPERFTLKNHDPSGGNVLFNDGSVKFIRSRKELQALKWK